MDGSITQAADDSKSGAKPFTAESADAAAFAGVAEEALRPIDDTPIGELQNFSGAVGGVDVEAEIDIITAPGLTGVVP